MLSHPVAASAAVARLTAAFEEGGSRALEGCERPRLSWREMREVQAWREGRGIEEDKEGWTRALEGEERPKELPAPPAAAEDAAFASAAARSGCDSASDEPELDLDALDF